MATELNEGTSFLAEAKYHVGRSSHADYTGYDAPVALATAYALIDIADSLRQITARLNDSLNVYTKDADER